MEVEAASPPLVLESVQVIEGHPELQLIPQAGTSGQQQFPTTAVSQIQRSDHASESTDLSSSNRSPEQNYPRKYGISTTDRECDEDDESKSGPDKPSEDISSEGTAPPHRPFEPRTPRIDSHRVFPRGGTLTDTLTMLLLLCYSVKAHQMTACDCSNLQKIGIINITQYDSCNLPTLSPKRFPVAYEAFQYRDVSRVFKGFICKMYSKKAERRKSLWGSYDMVFSQKPILLSL